LYSDYINNDTGETHKGWGEFELVGDQLHLFIDHGYGGQSESFFYNYQFSDDKLHLTLTYGDIITILEKI